MIYRISVGVLIFIGVFIAYVSAGIFSGSVNVIRTPFGLMNVDKSYGITFLAISIYIILDVAKNTLTKIN